MTAPPAPTFLGLGAPRAGTTTLHHMLAAHPGVRVPERKEVHYFTYHHPELSRTPMAWEAYLELFAGEAGDDEAAAGGAAVRGEISPSYLWVPGTARRIAARLPDVRLFAILRSPVERAISDAQYAWQVGAERTPLDRFFTAGIEAVRAARLTVAPFHPSAVVWKGLYALHLREYVEAFSADRIEVFLLDDLEADPAGLRRELLAHLGAEDRPLPARRHNARTAAEEPPAGVRELLAEFYRDSVRVLEDMLGRDLSMWVDG